LLKAHAAFTIDGQQDRRHAPQLHASGDKAFRHAETGGNVRNPRAVVDQRPERFKLVGGVHRHPHHVFSEADFGCIGVFGKNLASNRHVRGDAALFGQHGQRQKPPLPRDDGEFPP